MRIRYYKRNLTLQHICPKDNIVDTEIEKRKIEVVEKIRENINLPFGNFDIAWWTFPNGQVIFELIFLQRGKKKFRKPALKSVPNWLMKKIPS